MSAVAVTKYGEDVDLAYSSDLDFDLSYTWAHTDGARQFCKIISAATAFANQESFTIFPEDEPNQIADNRQIFDICASFAADCSQDSKTSGLDITESGSRRFKRKTPSQENTDLNRSTFPTTKAAKKSRRVSFAHCVKSHDGLKNETRMFDRLVVKLFCERDPMLVHSMCLDISSNVQLLKSLQNRANNLIEAILKNGENVPVLPQGGGSCIKLGTSHLEGLEWMRRVLDLVSTSDSPIE